MASKMQEFRDRQTEKGLHRVEFWAPRGFVSALKVKVERLIKRFERNAKKDT